MEALAKKKLIAQILQKPLTSLNIITREEFDIQTQVLLRTRLKVQELEKKLASLEQLIKMKQPPSS